MTDLRARAGEAITADKWNRLVAEWLGSIVGGPGIDVRVANGRVSISLREGSAARVWPARIVAVLGPAGGATPTALNLGYRVARAGLGDDAAIDIPPARVVGRINYTGDVALVPAPVGSEGLLRDWVLPDGTSEPRFEVWREAPVVTPACPEGAGVAGGGGGGDAARNVLATSVLAEMGVLVRADGTGLGGAVAEGASMEEVVEFEDLANVGDWRQVAVPAGATSANCQALAHADGGDEPLGEIEVGLSVVEGVAVYDGAGEMVIDGTGGVDGRTAMTGAFDVWASRWLYLRLRTPGSGSPVGRARVVVVFV